jgi:hypothetical protein
MRRAIGVRMRKLCFLFALAISSACAQEISVGALGGIRPTDAFGYGDESRWYEVGGSLEIRLPAQFAIEADALYQRIGFSSSFVSSLPNPSYLNTRERGNSWEFPLYVKHYFRPSAETWQPFVGTGFAFRTVSIHTDNISFNNPFQADGAFHFDYRSPLDVGASIAAGVRFHYGPATFLPQVRYTRWSNTSDQINANEVTLLLGVSF